MTMWLLQFSVLHLRQRGTWRQGCQRVGCKKRSYKNKKQKDHGDIRLNLAGYDTCDWTAQAVLHLRQKERGDKVVHVLGARRVLIRTKKDTKTSDWTLQITIPATEQHKKWKESYFLSWVRCYLLPLYIRYSYCPWTTNRCQACNPL